MSRMKGWFRRRGDLAADKEEALLQEIDRLKQEKAALENRFAFSSDISDEDASITSDLLDHICKVRPSYEALAALASFHCAHLSLYWGQGISGNERLELAIEMADHGLKQAAEAKGLIVEIAFQINANVKSDTQGKRQDLFHDIEFDRPNLAEED